jgi:hypothetical protein
MEMGGTVEVGAGVCCGGGGAGAGGGRELGVFRGIVTGQ